MDPEDQGCVSSSSGLDRPPDGLTHGGPPEVPPSPTTKDVWKTDCDQTDSPLSSPGHGVSSPQVSSSREQPPSSSSCGSLGDPQESQPSSSTTRAEDSASPTPAGTGNRAHELPPCKVCGGRATGFHYGANTCEACKGFFRRSLIRTEEYVCVKNVKCNIRPGKRNLCAFCRYQRCLAAGMSKDGIKTGRYTYAKRTQDLLEVRQLRQEESAAREKAQQEERVTGLLKLVDQVELAHYTHQPRNEPTLLAASKIQAEYLETQSKKETLKSVVGGDMSKADLAALCQMTGVPSLPEDRRSVWEGWMVSIERGLKGIVNFSKDLPGFKSLAIQDQIALLKHSVCEIWLISRHKAFNADHGLYTTITGFTFDVAKAVGPDIAKEVFTMATRLQKLNLTFQETHMLKAFVLFFADRCELADHGAVEALQQQYQDTLEFLLAKNHVGPHTFAKLILILTDLRHITELYFKHIQKVLSDLNVPPLFMEILSSS